MLRIGDDESGAGGVREPLVTFAEEPEQQSQSPEGAEADASTPAQVPSESGASTGAPESTKTLGEGTEITEPSLFGDDAPGQQQAAADFYSSIRSGRPAAIPDHLTAGERAQSSVAATMGSRTSSVASMEQLRTNTFKIYPSDELEADRLVTRAVILGDFDSAVTLCLALDRYADALLLAVRGGPDLLASTQKAYFRRHSSTTPYLRLFESVASDDLGDIVQNADLTDWQEIFVVLCTFARKDDFASYVESLGQRIEFAAAQTKNADAQEALRLRKNALLAYLAARRLEKVVSILVEEMAEEEAADAAPKSSGHAKALQSFIEKVAVFKAATGYTDADLTNPTSSQTVAAAGARAYKLGALYDRYLEYAELLASQGLSSLAVRYANQVPADYRTSEHDEATAHIRERLVAGQPSKVKAVPNQGRLGPQAAPGRGAGYAPPTMPSMGNPFNAYGSGSAQQPVAPIPAGPPPAQNNPYGPARTMTPGASLERPPMPPPQPQTSTPNLYAPPAATGNAYTSAMAAQPYGAPTNNYYGPPPTNTYTAPPPPAAGAPPPPPPPASSAARKPDQGWNDAPSVVPPPPKRAPSAGPPRQQITSPFPMAQSPAMPPSSSNGPYGVAPPMASSSLPPPPPRGSTISPAHNYRSPMPPGPPPPPPQAGPYAPAAMPPASSPYAPLPPGDNMPPPPHAAPSPYLPAAQPAQPPSFQAPPGGIAGPPQPMPPKPATPLKPEPPQPKYRESLCHHMYASF